MFLGHVLFCWGRVARTDNAITITRSGHNNRTVDTIVRMYVCVADAHLYVFTETASARVYAENSRRDRAV